MRYHKDLWSLLESIVLESQTWIQILMLPLWMILLDSLCLSFLLYIVVNYICLIASLGDKKK